jgi:pimeloyl-ACP methyl ester carboxylesterase
MPLDVDLLEAHRSFRDPRLGIEERFVRLEVGGAGTLGVLSAPLAEPRSLGWVICHAFGSEQIDLHMTDIAVARRLAGAGYPVLRFHCQGYGDSDDVSTPPTPHSHLRDTADAVRQLPGLAGVRQVGAIGSRFGATVAALTAEAASLPRLVMISPIANGAKYVTELLRSQVLTEMLKGGSGVTVEELRTELRRDGTVNIKGLALHHHVVQELQTIDLLASMRTFSGQALVIQVSRGQSPQSGPVKLAEHLKAIGARVELRVVSDINAPHFGYEHFQPIARDKLGDSLEAVNRSLAEVTLEWIRGPGEGE